MNRRNFLINTGIAAVALPLLGLPKKAEALTVYLGGRPSPTTTGGWDGQKLTGFVQEECNPQEPAGTLIMVHAPDWVTPSSVVYLYGVYRKSLGIVDHPTLLGDPPIKYLINPKGSESIKAIREYAKAHKRTTAVILTTLRPHHQYVNAVTAVDQIVRLTNDGFEVRKDRYGMLKPRSWQQIHQCQMDGSRD